MLTLEAFKKALGEWAGVPAEAWDASTDLTCDAGLDSLALEQVLSGLESLIPHLSLTEFWRHPTVGALYDRYKQALEETYE